MWIIINLRFHAVTLCRNKYSQQDAAWSDLYVLVWVDGFSAGWLMPAVPSTRLWKGCGCRYGLASEHSRAGITCLCWHCQRCPRTTNNPCCLSVAWRMLCNSFCTNGNPNTWVSCRIRGSECRIVYLLVALGWVVQRGEKRWREVVKTAFYPLLSCLLSFTSFTPLLLPKAGKRSKEANMKGIPEILFFAALSVIDMEMLNPKSSLYLGCRDYPASFVSIFHHSSPPLRLTPSSSSPSVLCFCLSLAALRLTGR